MRLRAASGLGVASLLISAAATAGVGVWTTNGPAGGANTVVVDPVGTLYAGSSTPPIPMMTRSVDSGTSWQSTPLSAWPLAAGPSGTVYAGSDTINEVDAFEGNLFKSNDGGSSWTTIIQQQQTGSSVTLDPFQPSTLFRVDTATTLNHPPALFGKLFRSEDGGTTWTEVDAGIDLSYSYISAFAPDPGTHGVFYLATAASQAFSAPVPPSSLYRTTDGGSNWTLMESGIHGIVTSLQVDPFSSSTLYAGVVATFSTGGSTGAFKSVDAGATLQQINTSTVNTIAMDPVRQGHVYLGTQSVGVQVTTDGGSSWMPMNSGLPSGIYPAAVYALVIDQRGEFLHAATGQSGVFDFQLVSSTCPTDSHTLCLNNGRFSVTANFHTTPEGPSNPATAVPLTSDTGYFWFFDPVNIELVVKVLTGCTVNREYWFFASGLTNVGVQINVTDTVTGATKPYSNTFGTAFQPIQDTSAFPCP